MAAHLVTAYCGDYFNLLANDTPIVPYVKTAHRNMMCAKCMKKFMDSMKSTKPVKRPDLASPIKG